MRKNVYFDAVKSDCVVVTDAWNRHGDLQIPSIDRGRFLSKVDDVTRRQEQIAMQERALAALKEERNDILRELNGHCNDLRLAAKLHYGVDSLQYGDFGGTRGFLRKARRSSTTTESGTVSSVQQN